MALHGLAEITVGVPDPSAISRFYEEFGLRRHGSAFASDEGGEQLRVIESPVRRLEEVVIRADTPDDLDEVRARADRSNIAYDPSDHEVVLVEPAMSLRIRIRVAPRLKQEPPELELPNVPGRAHRLNERPRTLFKEPPTRPRRLGHVAVGTPDLEATSTFLQTVVGFKLSDAVPDVIEFLRCSTDHHNIALVAAPAPFLHHSSWQVNSVDDIGHGATQLLAVDPDRHLWGLGRHFLGSNLFWYFRDPAGNFVEYYADLDEIAEDADWLARTWTPDKSLYAWGPPPPPELLEPDDLDEIVAALS